MEGGGKEGGRERRRRRARWRLEERGREVETEEVTKRYWKGGREAVGGDRNKERGLEKG